MIESANQVPRGTTLTADACIVGAGAAGIPLALSLSGQGLSVLLLSCVAVILVASVRKWRELWPLSGKGDDLADTATITPPARLSP